MDVAGEVTLAPICVLTSAAEGDAAVPRRAREHDVAQTAARSTRSRQGARRERPRDADRSHGIPWRGCATGLLLAVAACARPPAAVESTPEPPSPSPVAQLAASEAPATAPPAPSLPPKLEAPAEPTAPSRPTPTPTATLAPLPRLADVGFPGQGGGFTMAYTDEAGLWAYDGTEPPRLLLEAPDLREVALSEDGAWVAVRQWHRELLREGDREREAAYPRKLLILDVDRPGVVLDVDPVDLDAKRVSSSGHQYPACGIGDFAWVPGTDLLHFSTLVECEEEGPWARSPMGDLWLADVAEPGLRRRLESGQAYSVVPSPDGAKVAYLFLGDYMREVRVAEIDGEGFDVLLQYAGAGTESEWTALERPYWRPDGSTVLVATYPELDEDEYPSHLPVALHGGPTVLLHELPIDGDAAPARPAPSSVTWTRAALLGSYGLHISPDRTQLSMIRTATTSAPTAESPDAYPPPRPLSEIVVLDLDAPDPITQTARVEIPAAPSLRNRGWSRLGCRSGLLAGAGEGRSLFKPSDANAEAPWLVQASADAWPRDLDCRHVARLLAGRLVVEPLDRLLAETDEAREAAGPALLLAEGVQGLDVVTAEDAAGEGGAQDDVTEGGPDS